jgi:hypothetical protein
MRLSRAQELVLRAMAAGHFLKSHRDIEGHKSYKLHDADGGTEIVAAEVVEGLWRLGLIGSNQKFPVATYWLTEGGRAAAGEPAK